MLALFVLLPPLADLARRVQYGEALQIAVLAVAVPALVTLGAPWRILGLARDTPAAPARGVDRVAEGRRRHPEVGRSIVFWAADLAVVVAWHTPAAVAVVAAHNWLILLEAVTLIAFGVGLWLELIPSPPLVPRSAPLRRAALGALAMWAFWTIAYVVAMSTHDFYPNFRHAPGGLSAGADQQIAALVSWFVAAVSFVPVVFWNAIMWLRSDEDPDAELATLLRAERRRGTPPLHGGESGPAV